MLEADLFEMGYKLDLRIEDCSIYIKDNIYLTLCTRDNGLIEGKFEARFGVIKLHIGPFLYPNEHFKAFERGMRRAMEKLEEA